MASGIAAAGASYLMNEQLIPAVTDHIIPAVKDNLVSFAKEQFRGVWCLKDDIDKISERVKSYWDVKEATEKKQFEDQDVCDWLSDFKSVEYDVKDVVCDYQDMVVRVEENGQGVVRRWVMQAKDGIVLLLCGVPLYCLKDVLPLSLTPRIEIAHRLRFINKNLAKIEQRKANLPIVAGESSGNSDASITTSSVAPRMWEYEDEEMIGRDEIKMEIKRALLDHAAANIEESYGSKLLVIGIVGAGGMGKTTLAHNIYNDKDVTGAYESKEWLYVGDKFDLKGIMNKIIGNDESNKLDNEDELHSAMKNKLREKSMLIILDDTWCSSSKEWNLLGRSLSKGIKSCALVTTTRNKAVAKAICHDSEYSEHELTRMSDDKCLMIFKRWAFAGKNAKRYTELEGLSKMVVEEMKGVPLAAKIIGGLLYNYIDDHQKWINIKNDVKWLKTDEGNVVDKITELSYLHLPPHLRPCFAFCAMFSKGFEFEKMDLVHMWIVQGYIQPQGTRLIEDIGKDYFDDLHQRSLFQLDGIWRWYIEDVERYRMHDLIHDFAQKVFTNGRHVNASDIEDQKVIINESSSSIRHLTFQDEVSGSSSIRHLSSLDVSKKLRTLICHATSSNIKHVFANQFRHLRLLIVRCYNMKNLPDSVKHLKLLRYLNVSETAITSLSEKIRDLVNLQYLLLPMECEVLPEGMSKLVNLRCLQRGNYVNTRTDFPNFKGMGKLTCLQGRNLRFTVLNESGWRISELKDLNCLRGALDIYVLQNVKSMREAEQACLKEKKHLEKLKLGFADDNDVQILEGLRPPPFLRSLQIDSYIYDRRRVSQLQVLPRWMYDLPSTLVELRLCVRVSWERLPTLGRLPSLKKLAVTSFNSVRKIGPEFYSDSCRGGIVITHNYFPCLEEFSLGWMEVLEEWEVPPLSEQSNDDSHDNTKDQLQHASTSSSVYPCLRYLSIWGCPMLRTLSSVLPHLTALQKMEIRGCEELTSLVELKGGRRGLTLSSLEHLWFWGCPKLFAESAVMKADINAGLAGLVSLSPSLNTLQIECTSLNEGAQVSRWMMHNLPSTLLVQLHLTIDGFGQSTPPVSHDDDDDGGCWEHLPTLGHLPFLQELSIYRIHNVRRIGSEFYSSISSSLLDGGGDERDNIAFKTTEDAGEGSTSSTNIITSAYFPRLETFRISGMDSLVEWGMPPPVEGQINDVDNTRDDEELHGGGCGRGDHRLHHAASSSTLFISVFPCLRKLQIWHCPKLRTVSSVLPHLRALQYLYIENCPELVWLVGGDGASEEDDDRYSLPPSLQRLSITKCPLLEERWGEGGVDHPKLPPKTRVIIR